MWSVKFPPRKSKEGITRDFLKRISASQFTRMEGRVERAANVYFRGVVNDCADLLSRQTMPGGTPETIASRLARATVDVSTDKLIDGIGPSLLGMFIVGVRSEAELTKAAEKRTSAEEIADRLEIDVPDGIGLGPYPEWMLEAAEETLTDTMGQDYWQQVPLTTRGHIERTLRLGVEEGLSINKLSKLVRKAHGGTYTRARANNVARTETTNMINAGHSAGIKQLQEESGLAMGKEWVSVNGSTTRASHSAMDGKQTKDADDMFVLGGVRIPWPGHHSLPPENRCQCQCSIISAFNISQLTDEPTDPVPVQEEVVPQVVVDVPKPEAVEVVPAPVSAGIPHIIDLVPDDSVRLGGSTGARLYRDADGTAFVVKTAENTSREHLIEEGIADRLYRAAGANVPEGRMFGHEGQLYKVTRFIEGGKNVSDLPVAEMKKALKKARKDFGTDALLGNWDAAGADLDNLMVDPSGKVWRIDNGGSLRFRAQGQQKYQAFGDNVTELWTMRESGNAAARAFGGMKFSEVTRSASRALRAKKKIMDELDVIEKKLGKFAPEMDQLRSKLNARFDSVKEVLDTSKTLRDDDWVEGYVEKFAMHEQKIQAAGVVDKLAKQLKPKGGSRVRLYDENGDEWDHLRGHGEDNVTGRFEKYLKENGGDYENVKRYAQSQASDSWSKEAVWFKYHLAGNRKTPTSAYWWNEAETPTSPNHALQILGFNIGHDNKEYGESMTAQHALTHLMMKRIKLPNKKAKTISLVRTESDKALRKYALNKRGDYELMERGCAESFSLNQTFSLYGGTSTYQELPTHRVFAFYGQARRRESFGLEDGFLCGDRENEIVAMSEGFKSVRHKDVDSGERVLPVSEWKKLPGKREPDEPAPF